MTDEILSAERELPASLMVWLRQAATDPDKQYLSADSLLQAARDAGAQFKSIDYATGFSRKAPALALYRYLRTLRFGDKDPGLNVPNPPEQHDVPAASLDTAEQNLEQVGNAGVLEEGPAYATVAMGHALVVLAKSLDHQNYLLASLARTVEKIEQHLSVLAERDTGTTRWNNDDIDGLRRQLDA